jgi:hypothetical protein
VARNATFDVFCGALTQHHKQQTQIINLIIIMFDPDCVQWHNANEDTEAMRAEMEADDMVNGILMELLSSSEEEDEDDKQWGGSRKGRAPNNERDFPAVCAKLIKDYFNGTASVYNESDFERRLWMPRAVFNQIQDAVMGTDPFVQKTDICGKAGIHPLVKLVACPHFLAYGNSLDREGENLRIAQGTLAPIVKMFAN